MVKRKGFTLVELIVVIAAILAILFSIITVGLNAVRKKAKMTKAKSDMVALGQAIIAFNSVHKDDRNANDQWPRNLYTSGLNMIPWEITEGGFWSRSEPINTKLSYEKFPCSPNYGEYFNKDTQEGSAVSTPGYAQISYTDTSLDAEGSPTSANRKNACAATFDTAYVGINWAGLDGDLGLTDPSKAQDNGFLMLYSQEPSGDLPSPLNGKTITGNSFVFEGKFLTKIGGSDEKCSSGCKF